MGQCFSIVKEPPGMPMVEWVRTIPNNGLIRYLDFFNVETIIPTTPEALSEVLTAKNDGYIKPPRIRKGMEGLIGNGLVLSEGEEHKVSGIYGQLE